VEAVKRGIAFSMLPKEYGGGGLSNVDFVIAAEEICAVDAGFATTVLVNGLGLMPVWYYGTEEQKRRFIGAATADTTASSSSGTPPASRPAPRVARRTSTRPQAAARAWASPRPSTATTT
jgi:acyl-CoA dehydrogenase